MTIKFHSIGFLLLALFLSSCATIFSDRSDTITIKSEPSGADVYVNEELKGKTPLEFPLDRNVFKAFKARVKLAGFESTEFRINKTLNTTSIFNTTFILSWGTDALSGKMIQYSPTAYYVELKKEGRTSQLSPEEALRLEQLRFAEINFQKLQADIARGDGEYLTSYLGLSDLSAPQETQAKLKIKRASVELSKITDARKLQAALSKIY